MRKLVQVSASFRSRSSYWGAVRSHSTSVKKTYFQHWPRRGRDSSLRMLILCSASRESTPESVPDLSGRVKSMEVLSAPVWPGTGAVRGSLSSCPTGLGPMMTKRVQLPGSSSMRRARMERPVMSASLPLPMAADCGLAAAMRAAAAVDSTGMRPAWGRWLRSQPPHWARGWGCE